MKRLGKIIWKNLKLISRSKSSSIIFILGPILLIFLAGFAFNTSEIYRIKAGVYSKNYTSLTDSIISSLEENNVNIEQYSDEWSCIDAIKESQVSLCIVFNGNLQIGKDMNNELNLYVDYSQVNLAYLVLDMVSKGLSKTSSNLTASMTSLLLDKMFYARDELNKDKEIVQRLTIANKEEKDSVDSIKSKLDPLDFGIDMESFKTSDIKSLSSDIQKKADTLTEDVVSSLSAVEAKVNRLNITEEERDPIIREINRTRARATLISGQMGGKDSQIEDLVSEIEGSIGKIRYNLNQAETARTAVFKEIESTLDNLQEDLSDLAKLDKSFNSVLSTITSIQVTNAGDIAEPIRTNIKPVSVNKTHLYYLFPSLILVVVMFVSILLSSTLVMMEKASKAYIRNFITPARDITFVLATYFTSLFVVIIQTGLILLISFFVFKFLILNGIFVAIFSLLLSATVFIMIGMLIGYLFKSEDTSTLTSIFIGSVFIFLSGLILPMQSIPDSIVKLGVLNPFVIGEGMLRKSLFYGFGISQMSDEIVLLGTYAIVLFGIIMTLHKLNKKLFFKRRHRQPKLKK